MINLLKERLEKENENFNSLKKEEKEKEFRNFQRKIENFIYNEIDINNLSINDYFEFLERFYIEENLKFYNYIEELNIQLRNIIDL